MTESMVEKVARALSVADGFHPEATSNDSEEQPAWTLYVAMAKAAIGAMREPTPEMRVAMGSKMDWVNSRADWDAIFPAAIDAALKEQEKVG